MYSYHQNKAPLHHDSGGTPCTSVSVGPETLVVGVPESTEPSFADWTCCVLKFTGSNIGCPKRGEQGTVHMAQLLVPAVSRIIGALL